MDPADIQRRLEHALAKPGRNSRPSISSNSAIPSLKRERPPGQEFRWGAPPKSVQKMTDNVSVQQAWSILQSHGMNSTQLGRLHAQALANENENSSRGHIEPQKPIYYEDFVDNTNHQDSATLGLTTPIAGQDPPTAAQATQDSLPGDKGELALAAKEQRLVALVTQLISEYGSHLPKEQLPLNNSGSYCQISDQQTIQNADGSSLEADRLPRSDQSALDEQPTAQAHESTGEDEAVQLSDTTSTDTSKSNMDLEPNQSCKDCAASQQVAQLQKTIESLQQQVSQLQEVAYVEPELPPKAFVLYRVFCECGMEDRFGALVVPRKSIFLDPPHRVTGDRKWHLQGHLNAPEQTSFLEQNPDVVLLGYKDYTCKTDAAHFQWRGHVRGTSNLDTTERKPPSPSSESMLLNSHLLSEALSWATTETRSPGAKPDFSMRREIKAPYHYIYHTRRTLRDKMSLMDDEHQTVLKILLDYVERSFQASFYEANSLFSQGLVSFESLHYLFEPEMTVIHQSDSNDTLAYRTNCWMENMTDPNTGKEVGILRCWSWQFDGNFRKRLKSFTMEWPGSLREILPIKSLCVYPLKYEEPEEEQLFQRGEKFWNCTKRVYVSYDDEEMFGDPVQRGSRYMVDVVLHKQVNPAAFPQDSQDVILELASMKETPPRNFFLLLPSEIFGYSMQSKQWVPLKVDSISPVIWNMEAFDNLVVDEDTKELVKALVTNQLAKEKATDLMDGKGNGLVILLHGGPGTGKTLTAESVAELARKPLYRVTCGDIGTNVDAIDKHLQRVLHLGRLWGCVVLLDEADVFLEERSLADMERNALVSVFLRVLEYYDGILILTSNRVGTFDEAFKSRIQLALHYENLTRNQRRTIWENFIKRLEHIEKDNVNTRNLREYLDELAGHDMNGRQIRNALTTARQLALYKGKQMDYSLLKHAITVSSKFDQYLKNVKHNFSDDELAREGGVR